jgi:predicted  nucleic acid-binding Zn-ribbon protein
MSVASQLYNLQEIDLEIESNERTLNHTISQLGNSEAIIETQNRLASERQHLEELLQQQRSVEWEIDDITSKLGTFEDELYSGKIRNPKELTNLQQEIDSLKAKRRKLEDQVLEIMEKDEMATKSISSLESALKTLESEWQARQHKLSADIEQLKLALSDLKNKRELLANEIDPQVVDVYQELKKQRGTGVAKVEQGICRGCRISLPVTELQRVRSGSLVRCSSCGRILFLA